MVAKHLDDSGGENWRTVSKLSFSSIDKTPIPHHYMIELHFLVKEWQCCLVILNTHGVKPLNAQNSDVLGGKYASFHLKAVSQQFFLDQ